MGASKAVEAAEFDLSPPDGAVEIRVQHGGNAAAALPPS